jgi:N utilization substance protein A
MASNDLQLAFNEIADLRALPQEVIVDALQHALVNAYRKFVNASPAQAIEARIESNSGRARIFVEKEVAEEVISPLTEVTLEKARYFDPECQIGDLVMVQEEGTPKSFGRIAAQTAKQVILQRIRDAERNAVFQEFLEREGDLITGTVQSVNTKSKMVTLSLGRAEAVLQANQLIPNEHFHQHQKVRVYLVEVKRSQKGPQIICSRSHRNMLRRLLEYEVPEIYNGQVEIKSIAREAGYRSKVAVAALQEGIDPVGACVGMKGIRIQNIVKELHDEKIDVIEWNPSAENFILKALSPAKVTGVYLEEDVTAGRTALVIVPDDQLSLAIGREGQNARLAAKLTGWRIDIKSVTETVQGALENLDVPPLDDIPRRYAQMVEDARRIVEKKVSGRVIQPEEFTLLAKFADLVESHLLADRESERRTQQEHVEAVKATLPTQLFKLSVSRLGLNDTLTEALVPFGSVGQVMLSTLIDETRLQRILPKDGMYELQKSLDAIMEVEDFDELLLDKKAEPILEVAKFEPKPLPTIVEDDDVEVDAFGGQIIPTKREPEPESLTPEVVDEYSYEFTPTSEEDDDSDDSDKKKKDKKKSRRQLVYDEDSGEVHTKRQRKNRGGNKRGDWNNFDF